MENCIKGRINRRALWLVASAAASLGNAVFAQSTTWASAANGTFSTAANWTNGVPGAASTAVFTATTAPYTVTFTNSPSNALLQVSNGAVTFALNGNTYTLANAGTNVVLGASSGQTPSLTLTNGTLQNVNSSIGAATGVTASVSVGSGASWNQSGVLSVGVNGVGNLSVSSGGDVTNASATVGGTASNAGTVTVSGNGSSWTCNSSLIVGNNGSGTVAILSGGAVNSTGVTTIANAAGSTGNVLVSGTGSVWTSSSDVNVGGNFSFSGGTGTLTIGTGGAVTLTGVNTVRLWPGATVNLNGGTLSAASITPAGGNVNFNAGTVSFPGVWTADFDQVNTLLGGTAALALGRAIVVNSVFTLQTPLTLDGGTLSVNSFAAGSAANLYLTRGTLNVTGSNVSAGVGGTFNNGPLTLGSGMNFNVTGAANGFNFLVGSLLELQGGALSVTGSAGITNSGEIHGQSLTSLVSGTTLNNFGLIDGTTRLSISLDNKSGGELRASDGERLNFLTAAAAPINRGSISLLGGVIEFAQQLTNQSTGRITGRGTIIADGGISNAGTITLSAGLSDVMGGTVNNLNGSKVIVTGGSTSTFYGPVSNVAGSEFRVSTNSTAVFLGDVTGLAAFTGPGTKDFEANASGFSISSGNGSTIVGPAGNLQAGFVRDGSLQVQGNATISPNGSAAAVSRVGVLSINAGATLDLNDNDLIATNTAKATVESLVASARNNGAWNQPGLTSTTARNHPSHATGLGVLSGQEYLSTGQTQFDGFTVSVPDVLVKYTWNGDANLDGRVTFDDYVKIDTGFNTHLTGWFNGDFNFSGNVNFDDYVLIDIAFNQQNGTLGRAVDWISGDDRSGSGRTATGVAEVIAHFDQFGLPYASAFLAAVPDPSALGMIFVPLVLARRRRRPGAAVT